MHHVVSWYSVNWKLTRLYASVVYSKYSRGKTSHYGMHAAVTLKSSSSFVNYLCTGCSCPVTSLCMYCM